MTAEDLLTRTLLEVVETTDYPTTSTAEVLNRSRTIRRQHRRTTLLVAAAAVLALGGVSAAVVLDRHGSANLGPSSKPNPAAKLPDIPQGAAPKVGILYGDVYLTPQGERITSPAFRHAAAAAPTTGGVLVVSQSNWRHPRNDVSLVSDGATTPLGCGLPGFAMGPGDPVYWLFDDGCGDATSTGHLVEGTKTLAAAQGAPFPVATLDSGVVVNGPAWLPDPQKHPGSVRTLGRAAALVIAPDGTARRIPHLATAQTATRAGDLVAGLNQIDTSAVVVDASTGAVRWRAAAWTLSHFSASGQYVSGTQSVGPQTSPGVGDVVGIFDSASGRLVRSVVLPDMVVKSQAVWEGDDAVLVVAQDAAHQESILRIGVDGSVTRATKVLPPTEVRQYGFRLAATP
ncbi:MAG TPA: hypothetical protein VH085_01980 [Nocardioides sp.]|jgi:hypothetical protein|nr:hypothetical protein [Nocardioides sp.]